jgi:hypothetical protein
MQYAARLPRRPSTRSLAAPLIALVVGAGAATGAYALIDGSDSGVQPTKYIVVEQPAQGSAAIPGKDEAATAAAISGSQSSAVTLRGSKASATSTQPTAFSGHR